MKILVVEDDDKFRLWLLEVLKEAGYQVFESYNGKHALDWIRDHDRDVNLVITDILMPQVDGLEVLFELRRNFPHISAMTMSEGGISLDYCVKVSEAVGSKKFLPKPFQAQALFEAIREVGQMGDDTVLS